MLIMDCSEGLHQKFERSMRAMEGAITLDRFIDHTIAWIKELEGTFLLDIFRNGELEYLERKLPDELVAQHHVGDDEMVVRLFELLQVSPPENIPVFAGVLRGVFMTLLHKKTIGEEIYYDVLREVLAVLFDKYIEG